MAAKYVILDLDSEDRKIMSSKSFLAAQWIYLRLAWIKWGSDSTKKKKIKKETLVSKSTYDTVYIAKFVLASRNWILKYSINLRPGLGKHVY